MLNTGAVDFCIATEQNANESSRHFLQDLDTHFQGWRQVSQPQPGPGRPATPKPCPPLTEAVDEIPETSSELK